MEVINPNGVKVYNLSAGKTFPNFLSPAQRRKLAKDDDYRTRVELIQNFDFNQSCQKIKISEDGNFIVATGVYPPMIKCYDTQQMSEKFRRHLKCEVVQFQFLSEDFSKFVFLLADRTLEFHARYGFHYKTRIPKFGRDITYHKERCELFAVGGSPEIYRLDLEQGTFMEPILTHSKELNKVVIAPVHQMLTVGTIEGEIECYDSRTRDYLQCVKVFDSETRDLRFSEDGITLAVGSADGMVKLFDIRNNKPFLEVEHSYETPITSIKFNGDYLLSSDRKTVKISNFKSSECICNIEPENEINHMNIAKNSGLLFIASEQPRVLSYFIPSLGTAPKWCSYLDNITEELEEEKAGVYDDYKFVTKQELSQLGLDHLIGTDLLRAYMHGFFIDNKLYERSKSVANPFLYNEYKKEKNKKLMKEKNEKRIVMKNKKIAVNADLAEKMAKNGKVGAGVDDRFQQVFNNEDFAIDHTSADYIRSHATSRKRKEERSEESEESNEESVFEEDFELLNAHDDFKEKKMEEDDDGSDSEGDEELFKGKKGRKMREELNRIKPKKQVKFYGVKDNKSVSIPTEKKELEREVEKRKEQRTMSLGDRARALKKRR